MADEQHKKYFCLCARTLKNVRDVDLLVFWAFGPPSAPFPPSTQTCSDASRSPSRPRVPDLHEMSLLSLIYFICCACAAILTHCSCCQCCCCYYYCCFSCCCCCCTHVTVVVTLDDAKLRGIFRRPSTVRLYSRLYIVLYSYIDRYRYTYAYLYRHTISCNR